MHEAGDILRERPTPAASSETLPRPGDLVVWAQHASSTYTVGEFPGPAQVRYESEHDALQNARRFAEQKGVDCWLTEDGRVYGPVERYRSGR